MNAEDPMETEESTTQNDEGTPLNYEEQAMISTVVTLHFFMVFLVLIYIFVQLQVEKLKELSKQPDIYEMLTRSLAPNIWELDDVKKGLLCQVLSVIYCKEVNYL